MLIGTEPRLRKTLEAALESRSCLSRYAAGSADSLRRLRLDPYDVVITDPATGIDEDMALLAELRGIRPGVRVIVLAPESTPEEIIAALRARVFMLKNAPFDAEEIADYALQAGVEAASPLGIEVLSANRDWVSLRMNSHRLTAERVVEFFSELQTRLAQGPRKQLMMAFREILMNAIEHGAEFHPSKLVEVTAIHTQRAIVFYVHDPGTGFRLDNLPHSALSNPPDAPLAHIESREAMGMRPGGFGILLAKGIVNELIYNDVGNEVLLIKHTA
ncbi:MAG TPA: ATP-binding protein [Terriglobales bacterium]